MDPIQEYHLRLAICGIRVSQMTKTYHDIEAVTRLLEEKERDLEIAARIGQSLLDKNRDLQLRNDQLEEDVQTTSEKVSQLRHELGMKDSLLQIYTHDDTTPDSQDYVFGIGEYNIDGLRRRLMVLEEENINLKNESSQLLQQTDDLEEKENRLVDDCVQRLAVANDHVKTLSEDNLQKTENYYRQQEEITNLLSKVITLEAKIKMLTVDNAELQAHLQASQHSQKQLTTEIADLKCKYEECLCLLHESNEEMKALRHRQRPRPARQYSYTPFAPHDSLASELVSSIRSDSPESQHKQRNANNRILETARLARRSARRLRPDNLPGSNVSGSECDTARSSHRSSIYVSDNESTDTSYLGDVDSVCASPSLGRHGLPGSNDLETALRRLSLRQQQQGYERRYHDDPTAAAAERMTSTDTEMGDSILGTGGENTPTPCWSPDSYMSTGSALSGGISFKFPEKLQIVKPIEGSATLHQWQRLARPDLTSLLDERPGVMIKGERKLDVDVDMESYTLSDYEEDDEYHVAPRRYAENTSMTYTLTTATVLHPSDDYLNMMLTSSYQGSRPSVISLTSASSATMATGTITTPSMFACSTMTTSSSPRPTMSTSASYPPSTPVKPQSKATSTFSVSLGLAQTLRERGFMAEKFDDHRVSSIVTETMYDNTTRNKTPTPTIYTAPTTLTTTTSSYYSREHALTDIPPYSIIAPDVWVKGMDALTPTTDKKEAEFALNLTEKIKGIGLDSLFESRGARPKHLDLSKTSLPTATPPNSPTKSNGGPSPSQFSSAKETPASPTTPPNSPIATDETLSTPFSFKFSRPLSQMSWTAIGSGPQLGLLGKLSSVGRRLPLPKEDR